MLSQGRDVPRAAGKHFFTDFVARTPSLTNVAVAGRKFSPEQLIRIIRAVGSRVSGRILVFNSVDSSLLFDNQTWHDVVLNATNESVQSLAVFCAKYAQSEGDGLIARFRNESRWCTFSDAEKD